MIDWFLDWLLEKLYQRKLMQRRKHHKFVPRQLMVPGGVAPDPYHCGFVLADDGNWGEEVCNKPPEWHL